jgi:hypothetical protein
MFSGRGQRLFPPNAERLATRHIQLHSHIAHSKRSKDGHLAHYELVRIQIRPLSSDTPHIWALLPFLPPLSRCGSQNHRHNTFSCLSRSSWASVKVKDLVVVFNGLCLEGGWRAFLLPSAESFTSELTIKRNGRPGFTQIGHLLPQQGRHLAVLPCLVLSRFAMFQVKNNVQGSKE